MNRICFQVLSVAGIIFLSFISVKAQNTQKHIVDGSDGDWYVDSEKRMANAKVDDFLGRKSLFIKKGSHVLHSTEEFVNGTIEFDVAPLDESRFIVVMLRRESAQNFENIYLRAEQSGKFQALQYAPVINASSTWQLYPENMRTIDLPRNKWTHVKIDVNDEKLKIYINRSPQPNLEIARLRGIYKKGGVGFWSVVADRKSDAWSAAFSNFSITSRKTGSSSRVLTQSPPAGYLASWQVAKPIEKKEGPVSFLPSLTGWKSVTAEESGLINLNRALPPSRGRWTAFAKTNLKAKMAKRVMLNFGYSDDVTIFLNGEAVYSGVNGWQSRYPRYLGFVKLGNDSVFLKLRPGNNELIFAVTNRRFGWGFVAQVKDTE